MTTAGALMACVGAVTASAQVMQVSLDEGWRFRAIAAPDHADAMQWHSATVPGVVQTDLYRAGVIPDPFFGDNEKQLQWIGLTDWEYTDEFNVSEAMVRHGHVEMVFDGLDTFADVSLNGTSLLSADNMFRSWRLDVKHSLHAGKNTLRIVFHSPTNRITPMVAKLPYVIPGTGYEQLDRAKGIYPVSHYMRKAPYNYGWDWGPKFVTQGIWRPVRLEGWDAARVASFHVRQDSVNEERAVLEANLTVQADVAGAASLQVRVTNPEGVALPVRITPVQLDKGENHLMLPMRIEHPERWFPNGYGKQSRYTMKAELVRNGKVIAQSQLKTGVRSVELQRVPDKWGTSFTFIINGIPVFAKGANFVPLDSFPSNTTDAKRREILTAARDVHMNMLRIWGGGFYETDEFYDLCDELGLMVWHDFMFGGAMVPGDKAFQDNVRAESVEQVQRLSDHPSLTLWCGNNEVETAWHGWGDQIAFQKSVTPEQRERVWQDYVVMFRDILKSTVATYGNGVPYWPSSPGSNFDDVPAGQENGDMHSWKVWSAGAPVTEYATNAPRFLSEFGFQSMPDLRTVRAFAGSNEDLTSPALLNHERFIHGFDRMQQYLKDEFKPARDFASFVYLSQVMQAEAIKFGVEHMRTLRPETMGTLYWQLDDCWPVASWSSLDYFGRWKALHYYAARFYAPVLVAAEAKENQFTVHVVSDELQPRRAELHLRLLGFDGTLQQESRQSVQVAALASTAVEPIHLKSFDAKQTVAVLTLEQDGKVIATNTVYFARSKDLFLPEAKIVQQVRVDKTGYVVELRSPVLARAVALGFGSVEAKPEDNYFDLLPNESREIHVASKASLEQVKASLELRSLVDAAK
ncbi:glycoside hydrolase family 2 protein [Granulicella sp. dw_53]|uniref:beta-mannosidase n=1 Tax=Granulicella sp. dw_53 TaxID=2719792 RepID=UPI001BD461E3|nr:glycoside hydrolase family 2 protein [Granulicella sp. dw_53]